MNTELQFLKKKNKKRTTESPSEKNSRKTFPFPRISNFAKRVQQKLFRRFEFISQRKPTVGGRNIPKSGLSFINFSNGEGNIIFCHPIHAAYYPPSKWRRLLGTRVGHQISDPIPRGRESIVAACQVQNPRSPCPGHRPQARGGFSPRKRNRTSPLNTNNSSASSILAHFLGIFLGFLKIIQKRQFFQRGQF